MQRGPGSVRAGFAGPEGLAVAPCVREASSVCGAKASLLLAGLLTVLGAPAPAEAEPAWPLLLVAPAVAAEGVPIEVADAVEAALRRVALESGYEVLPSARLRRAAHRYLLPMPASEADLWRWGWAIGGHRVVQARITVVGQQYRIRWLLVSLDGSGAEEREVLGGPRALASILAQAFADALPPPDRWDASAARRFAARRLPWPRALASHAADSGEPAALPPRRRAISAPAHPWGTSTMISGGLRLDGPEGALWLAGVRLDRMLTGSERAAVLLGASLLYADLPGRRARARNLLGWLDVESRLRFSRFADPFLSVRLGIGYLPRNGPLVRIDGGVGWPIGERFEGVLLPAAVSFWLLPRAPAITWNPSGQLRWRW